jgi:hypothetical protein
LTLQGLNVDPKASLTGINERGPVLPPCPHCTSRYCGLICRFTMAARYAFMGKK